MILKIINKCWGCVILWEGSCREGQGGARINHPSQGGLSSAGSTPPSLCAGAVQPYNEILNQVQDDIVSISVLMRFVDLRCTLRSESTYSSML